MSTKTDDSALTPVAPKPEQIDGGPSPDLVPRFNQLLKVEATECAIVQSEAAIALLPPESSTDRLYLRDFDRPRSSYMTLKLSVFSAVIVLGLAIANAITGPVAMSDPLKPAIASNRLPPDPSQAPGVLEAIAEVNQALNRLAIQEQQQALKRAPINGTVNVLPIRGQPLPPTQQVGPSPQSSLEGDGQGSATAVDSVKKGAIAPVSLKTVPIPSIPSQIPVVQWQPPQAYPDPVGQSYGGGQPQVYRSAAYLNPLPLSDSASHQQSVVPAQFGSRNLAFSQQGGTFSLNVKQHSLPEVTPNPNLPIDPRLEAPLFARSGEDPGSLPSPKEDRVKAVMQITSTTSVEEGDSQDFSRQGLSRNVTVKLKQTLLDQDGTLLLPADTQFTAKMMPISNDGWVEMQVQSVLKTKVSSKLEKSLRQRELYLQGQIRDKKFFLSKSAKKVGVYIFRPMS